MAPTPLQLLRDVYVETLPSQSSMEHPFSLPTDRCSLSPDLSKIIFRKFDGRGVDLEVDSRGKTGIVEGTSDEEYELIAILVWLQSSSIRERMKICKEYNCKHIKVMDKKKLVAYFTDKKGGVAAPSGGKKRKADDVSAATSAKKKKSTKSTSSAKTTASTSSTAKSTGGQKFTAEEMITRLEKTTKKVGDGGEDDMECVRFDPSLIPSAQALKADKFRTLLIEKGETPTETGDSILVSKAKSLEIAMRHYAEMRRAEDSKLRAAKSSSTSAPTGKEKEKPVGVPIIVVPNAMTANINMLNAESFIKDSRYERSVEMSKKGMVKKSKITFSRILPKTEKELEYEIIDNPEKLSKSDWNRIVCVVTGGAEWQFKGWQWKTSAEIFSRSCGYYFSVQGEIPPKILKKWNVNQGVLQGENGREKDMAVCASFWTTLDNWMSIHKPELLN